MIRFRGGGSFFTSNMAAANLRRRHSTSNTGDYGRAGGTNSEGTTQETLPLDVAEILERLEVALTASSGFLLVSCSTTVPPGVALGLAKGNDRGPVDLVLAIGGFRPAPMRTVTSVAIPSERLPLRQGHLTRMAPIT